MLLELVNILANVVIWAGAVWAVLTRQVPTRCGGAIVLLLIAVAAIANIVAAGRSCTSGAATLMNGAIALGICWAFWRLQLKGRCQR